MSPCLPSRTEIGRVLTPCLLAAILGVQEARAQAPVTIPNPTHAAGDRFFGAVAAPMGPNFLLTANEGANGGNAYLVDGTTGALLRTFPNPTPAFNDRYGHSVAAIGGNVAVGAIWDDTVGTDEGAVYVFDGATGSLLRTLHNPGPGQLTRFGAVVAELGGNLLVGAPFDETNGLAWAGAVYLFDGNTGALLRTFRPPAPLEGGLFGLAIAAVGGNVLVGAPSYGTTGSAYLFDGATGALLHTFHPPPLPGDTAVFFGLTLAAAGANVFVGTTWADDGGVVDAGAVFVFDASTGALVRTLRKPGAPASGDLFGYSLAPMGINILVGAPGDDAEAFNGGRAYLFDGTTGALLRTFSRPTPMGQYGVGWSVAASGQAVLVGVPGADPGFGEALLFAAPLADAGPDQSIDEGAAVQLHGCGTAVGLQYSWAQIAGSPTVTLSDPHACDPTFTAPPVAPGGVVLTFELTVSNGANSSSDTMDVTVRNVNHAPVADAGGDQAVNEATAVILDGSNTYDPDADPLTYSWVQTSGPPVSLTNPSSAVATFVAPSLASGTVLLTFELTASDGSDASTDAAAITVENVNHPPQADAGPDGSAVAGQVVALDGSGSADPDGDGLTYQWTQVQGAAVTISGAGSPVATFVPVQPGTYAFRLTVTDPGGLRDDDDVVMAVIGRNDPPTCDTARATSSELWPPNHRMIPVGITGVIDSDGDPVTVAILAVGQDEPTNGLGDGDTSPDAVVQGATVLLRAERSGTGNGRVYHLAFRADDGAGGSCTGTVTVIVPRDMRKPITAVDGGPLFDSTRP